MNIEVLNNYSLCLLIFSMHIRILKGQTSYSLANKITTQIVWMLYSTPVYRYFNIPMVKH